MYIYFYCPSETTPTGGIKQIFDFSSAINKCLPTKSFVCYSNKNFFPQWFKHDVKNTNIHICNNFNFLTEEDILVVPETKLNYLKQITKYKKIVIFNQNASLFLENTKHIIDIAIKDKNIKDIICVSNQNIELLKNIYPDLNYYLYKPIIDQYLFYYYPIKKKQICFMNRKNVQYTNEILSEVIKNNLSYVNIYNEPQQSVAQKMKESLVFFYSTNIKYEGFMLPPAEAMACGCVYIGNPSGGAFDYLNNTYYINTSNNSINEIINIIKNIFNNEKNISKLLKNNSKYILNQYSKDNHYTSVRKIFKKIIENN